MRMQIHGDSLTQEQRRLVLAKYSFRWTKDNPARERVYQGIDKPRSAPTMTDEEWLRSRAFHFDEDGKVVA